MAPNGDDSRVVNRKFWLADGGRLTSLACVTPSGRVPNTLVTCNDVRTIAIRRSLANQYPRSGSNRHYGPFRGLASSLGLRGRGNRTSSRAVYSNIPWNRAAHSYKRPNRH